MLEKVSSGKLSHAMRLLVYGQPGVGKSSFASGAPGPLFLGQDHGTGHLDVARFPEPSNWEEVHTAVKEYASASHNYKTLVLDPIGWLEPIAHRHVCTANSWNDIEQPGWGKGYNAAVLEWRRLLSQLERAWLKGSNIILIAHSSVRTFQNPLGDNYDRYIPAVNEKLGALLTAWADGVFFACHDVKVSEDKKAVIRAGRVLKTTYGAAYEAKNRWGLPEQIPLSWDAFQDAVKEAEGEPLENQIEALLAKNPKHEAKVRAAMKGATRTRMREILNQLRVQQ